MCECFLILFIGSACRAEPFRSMAVQRAKLKAMGQINVRLSQAVAQRSSSTVIAKGTHRASLPASCITTLPPS